MLDQKLRSLVMLAGQDNTLPETNQQQGPYHSSAQAQAALNAIAKELINKGFHLSDESLIWQINAQSLLKKNRSTREKNATDTTFVPLGIPPKRS